MLLRSSVRGVFVAALALVACENADAPQTPAWGKERCGSCAMLVDDHRFAGQAVTEKGEHLFFDDPGCLASYVSGHPRSRHTWLLNEHGAWVDAGTATFEANAKSPMDYGFQVKEGSALHWQAVVDRARVLRQGAGR